MAAEPATVAKTPNPAAAPDLAALLAPIPGDRPAGEALRYSGLYDAVQEARREDDAALPQGIWKTQLKRADWRQVAALTSEALAGRSKDLQLAVWLLEAWTRLDRVPGIVRGLDLLLGLCEAYWPDLHPLPEEGDLDYRVAPFVWLNEKVSLVAKQVPLVEPEPADEPAAAWSLADWEAAARHEQLARAHPEAAKSPGAERAVTVERFMAAVAATPAAFYAVLDRDLGRATAALARLQALLDGRCGAQSPSLYGFREVLGAMRQLAERVLRERGEEAAPEVPPELWPGAFEESPAAPPAPLSGGRITSRAEAYHWLAEAADYLLRTEPHSPTPYLVRRAVSWGNLSLTDLLRELVQNEGDLKTIYALLGVREIKP